MFRPKMAIISCLNSSACKDTAIFVIIVIIINLLIATFVCFCKWLLVPGWLVCVGLISRLISKIIIAKTAVSLKELYFKHSIMANLGRNV
jgi:hypothetical protein